MRFWLNACETITAVLFIYAIVSLIVSIVRSVKKTEPFVAGINHMILKHFKTLKILPIIAIIIIGVYNYIHRTFYPVLQIGALYEPPEYTQKYEAELVYGDSSMPCIAHIQCTTGYYDEHSSGKSYFLYKLEVPGGQNHDIDYEECSWNYKSKAFVSRALIGGRDESGLNFDFHVIINPEKIADSSSVGKLHAYTFHEFSDGYYVASKNSGVLHCERCRYVKQIKYDNIMRFDCEAEAIATGHWRPCDVCYDNW